MTDAITRMLDIFHGGSAEDMDDEVMESAASQIFAPRPTYTVRLIVSDGGDTPMMDYVLDNHDNDEDAINHALAVREAEEQRTGITPMYIEHREPIDVYGTPEHEAWLMECEAREG